MPQKGESLPHITNQEKISITQYKTELMRLVSNTRATLMMRMLAETGMAAEELVNIRKDNLDIQLRKLYLPKSKKIKDKKNRGKWMYKERNRYVPINVNLLPLLVTYMNSHDSPYIFPPTYKYKKIRPMKSGTINELFLTWKIPWSPHKFRHYFRMATRYWMIKERRVDEQVIKEIMGHKLDMNEQYGGDSMFEYKLEIVDAVFG